MGLCYCLLCDYWSSHVIIRHAVVLSCFVLCVGCIYAVFDVVGIFLTVVGFFFVQAFCYCRGFFSGGLSLICLQNLDLLLWNLWTITVFIFALVSRGV